jgi:hypothetical protein
MALVVVLSVGSVDPIRGSSCRGGDARLGQRLPPPIRPEDEVEGSDAARTLRGVIAVTAAAAAARAPTTGTAMGALGAGCSAGSRTSAPPSSLPFKAAQVSPLQTVTVGPSKILPPAAVPCSSRGR